MPAIHAVLFDYGLVLSAPPVPSAWERMKSITGQDESAFHAAYWAPRHAYDRGTHTGPEYWRLVAGTLDDAQIAALIAADIDLWGDLNLPMVEFAQRLQRAGIRTGILSNMGDSMAAGLLARHDWLHRFDHHTWSHAIKFAKPEPEIYAHAAAGLDTALEHILFLDDKPENIAAAERSGMNAILYTTHAAFEQEMGSRGLGNLLEPSASVTL